MSMFRRLMLGMVLSLSLVAPSGLLARGEVHPGHRGRHHHDVFYVRYRTRVDGPWRRMGPYRSQAQANRAAQGLRNAGYEAFPYGHR
jgi:hypothetical protein